MKTIIPILTLLISMFFLIQGCGESATQQQDVDQNANNYLLMPEPKRTYLNIDSLPLSIPGRDGVKKPKKVLSNLPKSMDVFGIGKVVPGISFLQQTMEEKVSGELPVKSKKPDTVRVDFAKLIKQKITNRNQPLSIRLDKELYVYRDSLPSYERIASRKGLISIQNNDSIFPPLSFAVDIVNRTNALPLRYKDEAVFDISILDAEQGLPNPFVRSIAMDAQGVLWLASLKGGLIAYDGKFFNEYKFNTSETRELMLDMLIDKNGCIWTGTTNGANCFDGKRNTNYSTRQGLLSNIVVAIIEDSKNNLWFATDEGVSKFDGETITNYTTEQGLPKNYVYSLFEDDKGNIWFGTFGGGVSRFDGEIFTTFTQNDGLPMNIVLSISQDHNGNMWFGTNGGGVSMFDGATFINYSIEQGLSNNVILSITEDANNNMWFGSYGSGLCFFNGKSFLNYTAKEGLSDNYVRSLFEDKVGNIWLGSDAGISKFNKNSFVNYTKSQGLINNNITSIFQDNKGRLWFADYDHGVSVYDESEHPSQNGTFTQITTEQGLANNIVNSIMQDNNNNFWFGTYGGGVSKLDGKSFEKGKLKFTNYSINQGVNSNVVKDILQTNDGSIWMATEGGVSKLSDDGFVTISLKSLEAEKALCVYQDKSNAIWIGTMGGGVSRLYNDTLTCYTTDQGLGNNTVWTIIQDQNGVMWFGTDGGGLSYFNGNSFSTINTDDGLCNNIVFSLTNDDSNSIWAGTFKGLSLVKFDDAEYSAEKTVVYKNPTIINYNKMDGLKGIDFYTRSGFHDNKNRLWWGTNDALTMLDLNNFKLSTEIPIVHMNGVTIDDQTIDFNSLKSKDKTVYKDIYFSGVSAFNNIPNDLSVPFNKNHLTFYFSAIDWSSPNQIKYKYKLIGYDDKWSLIINDGVADYRNISYGNYTFVVKAIGKTGKWSEELKYPINIRWPWWQSWWAVLIYIIALIFVLWLIIQWRVNIIKRQKAILESTVASRTKDLDEALMLAKQATNAKSQFIATMSHEIRTPLNAIMGLTHLAIDNAADAKQEDYLQKIDRSANTMLSLIDDILDFSKMEVGKMKLEKIPFDIEIVLNSVIIINAQSAIDKNLELIVRIKPEVPRLLIGDSLRLGQVITNLVSNSIKFTSAGEVEITIGLSKKQSNEGILLEFTVRDTGIGISGEHIPLLFDTFQQADSSITRKYGGTGLGLAISKLLIEMMDGHIWLESKVGEGTVFFFDALVGVQHKTPQLVSLIPDELKGAKLLVCDKNPVALKALAEILETLTFNVETIICGKDVLSELKRNTYDLLIIDHNLNGVSGIEIIKEIFDSPEYKPIKTILITNSGKTVKSLEQKNIDVDGYLIKPILPSNVMEKILDVFDLQKSASKLVENKETRIKSIKKAISGNHILLVEDNEINRQVIFELLEKINVKVDIAENGEIAVQKTFEISYDLILMDLHMPVMDGMQATKQIRKHKTRLPIVALTADAMDDTKILCKQIGFDDIITKPIDPDLLYDILNKWMSPRERASKNISSASGLIDLHLTQLSVKELDVKTAIRRFGDNEDLYGRMLKKFIDGNKNTCTELKGLVLKSDFKNAHLKIHTLKGESANIGAGQVYKLSKEVEQTIIKKDIIGFEKELPLLQNKFDFLSSELQSFFQEQISDNRNDLPSLKVLVDELLVSLKNKDPRAFDLLDKLNEFNVGKANIEEINKSVNSGNYEQAIVLLKKVSDS